jgi:hypothetical protein
VTAQIQAIFIDPPIGIARLGGSDTPMDSFRWVDSSDPHLQTIISPDWSLGVDSDGFVTPRMPQSLIFRDGGLIRPVAPFFELWALLGEPGSDPASWQPAPLTQTLLTEQGGTGFTLTIDARNRKAARRARNPALEFGTSPPVTIQSDNNRSTAIIASSPAAVERPMIPRNSRGIHFGSVQILRSQPQPTMGSTAWASEVRVDVFRFRFTPAKGEFYGPAGVENRRFNGFAPIKPQNAFLDGGAGWAGTRRTAWIEPADTFDGTEIDDPNPAGGPSLGIVDDTCSAVFTVDLRLPGRTPLSARACAFVSPPDFAPDRRPFLSLADELNDRSSRSLQLVKPEEREAWVRDLFERVYETASLFNLDFWRSLRAITLPGDARRNTAIAGDQVARPERAMGGLDKLRADDEPIREAPTNDVPLPLTERAKTRHRNLAELDELKTLVLQQNQRLASLIRPPFTLQANKDNNPANPNQLNEDGELSNMQMPPFMRNSNANPLTLTDWQYDLLMRWAASLITPAAAVAAVAKPAAALSERAARRQRQVMARLGLR